VTGGKKNKEDRGGKGPWLPRHDDDEVHEAQARWWSRRPLGYITSPPARRAALTPNGLLLAAPPPKACSHLLISKRAQKARPLPRRRPVTACESLNQVASHYVDDEAPLLCRVRLFHTDFCRASILTAIKFVTLLLLSPFRPLVSLGGLRISRLRRRPRRRRHNSSPPTNTTWHPAGHMAIAHVWVLMSAC